MFFIANGIAFDSLRQSSDNCDFYSLLARSLLQSKPFLRPSCQRRHYHPFPWLHIKLESGLHILALIQTNDNTFLAKKLYHIPSCVSRFSLSLSNWTNWTKKISLYLLTECDTNSPAFSARSSLIDISQYVGKIVSLLLFKEELEFHMHHVTVIQSYLLKRSVINFSVALEYLGRYTVHDKGVWTRGLFISSTGNRL